MEKRYEVGNMPAELIGRGLRLTRHHPDYKALERLFHLADELNIRIEVFGLRTIVSIDGREYDMEDIENRDEPIEAIPPYTEYKLVRGVQ